MSKVILSTEEKKKLCLKLAEHLPRIRSILHLSQKAFGDLCGVSKDRVYLIEKKKYTMTWSQYTSILFLSMCNIMVKEYLFVNQVISVRLIQYIQQRDESIPPAYNTFVSNNIIEDFVEGKAIA